MARTPKPINIDKPAPPHSRIPKPIELKPNHRGKKPRAIPIGCEKERNLVDTLLERANQIDPAMVEFHIRLRPRFATLINTVPDNYINWGENNLVALREVTKSQMTLASRINALDAKQWIDDTIQASTRKQPRIRFFSQPKDAGYFQGHLSRIRAELANLLPTVTKLWEQVHPDAEDLRMDIMAVQVFAETLTDSVYYGIAGNRIHTLVGAQQTVLMTLTSLDQCKTTCSLYIQTIDDLLNVTIPNWQLSGGK